MRRVDLHQHRARRIEELVADPALRGAIAAIGEGPTYDEFAPTGPLRRVEVTFERSGESGEARLTARIHPRRVSMAYEGFPYRVEDIHSGVLTIDVIFPADRVKGEEPITVTLDRLHGRHGDGRVTGEGTWRRTEAGIAVEGDTPPAHAWPMRLTWDRSPMTVMVSEFSSSTFTSKSSPSASFRRP